MSVRVNSIVLSGRLTQDAETIKTEKSYGTKLNVAHNIPFKRRDNWEERTFFLEAVRWSQYPPRDLDYLKKGDEVIVEGSLDVDEWTDRTTGKPRSKLKLKIDRVSPVQRQAGSSRGHEAPREPYQGPDRHGYPGDDIPF